MELYPFKFHPIFIDKLWGGKRLRDSLGKDCSDICGESWEISAVSGNISVVANGELAGTDLQTLIREYGTQLLGKKVHDTYGEEFPLLVKFLDANDDLSVQVHPNDEQAMARHGTRGKTEMWYVMEAEPEAKLIAGLREGVNKEKYQELFESGRILEALNYEDVFKGDTFFIPAGQVHTIGKGIVIAEVQETSDITYRIYDFDRIDINGKKRDLHVEESLEVINFEERREPKVKYNQELPFQNLVACKHFTTNRLLLVEHKTVDHSQKDSFVIYICTSGELNVEVSGQVTPMKMGESLLIPASINAVNLKPSMSSELLEVYLD